MTEEKPFCASHPLFCQKLDEICDENKKLRENVYGEGPDGEKGVYGALKKKVSMKVFSVIFALAIAVVGWVMLHESRISKAETTLTTLCKDVDGLRTQNTESTKAILKAIERIQK